MAYEDFTTFTEVDVAADRIQKTANHIDHDAYANETTYLYKDYGNNHFGDFTHKIKIKCASMVNGANAFVWMLANDLGDIKALLDAGKTAIDIHFNGALELCLTEIYNTTPYSDSYSFSTGTWYYVKVVKSGTSLNAYIYSDAGYSNLLDTLTLTLHADHQFKYLYGCNTYNYGSSVHAVTDIENFDIGELLQETKAFTCDAPLKKAYTKAFTADAILKKTTEKTYTADAVLVNRETKTYTTDARIELVTTKTVSCDSIVISASTKTFDTDAVLSGKISGITRDCNGDVLGNCTVWLFKTSDKSFIEETTSNASGEYTFDGLLAGIDYFIRAFKDGSPNVFGVTDDNREATSVIDILLHEGHATPKDVILRYDGETITQKAFSVDALLHGTPTKTFSVDAALKDTSATKTFTANARLRGTSIKTYSVDTFLLASKIKIFTANALLRRISTKAFSVDSILINRLTKSFSSDALLLYTDTKTFTVDALLRKAATKTFSVDASLVNIFTKTYTSDAVLKQAFTKTFSTDVLLSSSHVKTFSADAITKYVKQFTVDTLLGDVWAPYRGFYYSKLGTDNFINPPDTDFNVTIEHNGIASFDFVIQNNAANRTIIADHLTEDFKIMRDDGTEILTGSIDSDRIEYFAEGEGGAGKRIRLSGYASFIDLAYLIYKRMADADAEAVGSVQDEDNSTATFTDYTTAANNDTINDVIITFDAPNDALYVGKDETFFAAKVKYSTKGIQAANTTVVIEYSKGSDVWATLDCIDESYAFTEDAGTYLLYTGNKPDDWAKDTINGKNQYHIRFRITQGSYSTKPKLDRIWLSNADVCRVQFNEVSASTILGYVLADTGYSEDATDQCPTDAITIRGEYDSKLRWIFGLGSALTWEDANGDKQRYDVWIDTANKTHFKQQRGTDKGDLSGDFRAVNNKMGYHGIGTRIFGAGGYDGINQKRAIVEDTTAQATHKLREIVLEDSKITGYEALKAETQKSLTIRKAPLKEVSGDIDTKYWLDNSLSVGDKITINQPDWNLNDQEFGQELYIMRAVIDPSNTHLDLGTSQMHLEHMRSSLQRQMDINNVWMAGSVSTYVSGPVEDNYQRVDNTTVYPVTMKIQIPSNARAINRVEISWTLSEYKSSVKPSSSSGGGHNHSHGGSGGGGGHSHSHGGSGGGGGHYHTENSKGGHIHTIGPGGSHAHNIVGTTFAGEHSHGGNTTDHNGYHKHNISVVTNWAAAHSHSNPNTNAAGSHEHGMYCYTNYAQGPESHTHLINNDTQASSVHSHSQGSTYSAGSHAHSISSYTNYAYVNHHHGIYADGGHQHGVDMDAAGSHGHGETTEGGHIHTIGTEPDHSHTVPDSNTEPNHAHSVPDSNTEPNHDHTTDYGVSLQGSGTILELIVNDVLVANNYVGDQTNINITGWVTNSGMNTVKLQPIVGDNAKGRAEISSINIVFLENLK